MEETPTPEPLEDLKVDDFTSTENADVEIIRPDGTRIIRKAKTTTTLSHWTWFISVGIILAGGIYIWLKWKNKNKTKPADPEKKKEEDENAPKERTSEPESTELLDMLKPKTSTNKREERVRTIVQQMFGVVFPTEWMKEVRSPKNRPLQADIINHELMLWIEVNGKQHYLEGEGDFGMTREDIEYRMELDQIRETRARELGYTFCTVKYDVPETQIEECIRSQLTPQLLSRLPPRRL